MSNRQVYVFANWKVKPGYLNTVVDLVRKVAAKSTLEDGNLFYKITKCNTDENTLILFEGYQTEEAQKSHASSAHFQQLVIKQIVPLLENREIFTASPIF